MTRRHQFLICWHPSSVAHMDIHLSNKRSRLFISISRYASVLCSPPLHPLNTCRPGLRIPRPGASFNCTDRGPGLSQYSDRATLSADRPMKFKPHHKESFCDKLVHCRFMFRLAAEMSKQLCSGGFFVSGLQINQLLQPQGGRESICRESCQLEDLLSLLFRHLHAALRLEKICRRTCMLAPVIKHLGRRNIYILYRWPWSRHTTRWTSQAPLDPVSV